MYTVRTRNCVTRVQNCTVLYDLVLWFLLDISVVLPATQSVFLCLITRAAVPMPTRVTVASKTWFLQTTNQGVCTCLLEAFTGCRRWGICEREYRVWKHVICRKNIGAGTVCQLISNGGTRQRNLFGASHRAAKISKKALIFPELIKTLLHYGF